MTSEDELLPSMEDSGPAPVVDSDEDPDSGEQATRAAIPIAAPPVTESQERPRTLMVVVVLLGTVGVCAWPLVSLSALNISSAYWFVVLAILAALNVALALLGAWFMSRAIISQRGARGATNADSGSVAPARESAVAGRRLSSIAIGLDIAALAAAIVAVAGVVLAEHTFVRLQVLGGVLCATSLLSLAGVVAALVARNRARNPLAASALVISVLLFVPMAWATFVLIAILNALSHQPSGSGGVI